MKITVVGTGAIGSFYGGKLAYHGCDVHFLVRRGFAKIRRSGIRIQRRKENFHIARVQVYGTADAIGPCDLVMITLKATNNDALLQLIAPLLHPRTILLTLQNGLGNEDFVARYFGTNRVMGGLCFSPYKPSSLVDFEAGRAHEVEAIWGEPLRRDCSGGTARSRLNQLYALLKSLNARCE